MTLSLASFQEKQMIANLPFLYLLLRPKGVRPLGGLEVGGMSGGMSEKKEKPIKVTRISLKEFEEIEKRSKKPNPSEKWDKILREVQRGKVLRVEGLSRGEILTLIRYIKRKHLPVRHVCSLKEGMIYLAPSVKSKEETKEETKKEEAKKEKAKKSTKKAKEKEAKKEAKEEAKEAPTKVEPTA